MASTSKKFPLNLTSTSRYFRKRFAGSQENIHGRANNSGSNNTACSPNVLSVGGYRQQLSDTTGSLLRSSSATDVTTDPDIYDAEDFPYPITPNMRQLYDDLINLKSTIDNNTDSPIDAIQAEAQEKLTRLLATMRTLTVRFPSLPTADMLTAVNLLTKKIDDNFDGSIESREDILNIINNIALIVSNSLSDCFLSAVGDDRTNLIKTKSLNCLAPEESKSCQRENDVHTTTTAQDGRGNGGSEVMDDSLLYKLEAGVEIALLRAQAWSKYTKELVTYVERRINLWGEFARSLSKLAKSVEQTILEDSFLPLQSIFITALSQDVELASMSQAARSLILNQKFVPTLNARKVEHDKIRKNLKYMWAKQVRKLHDAIANLRKAKSNYVSRQQEYEKMKEGALKAESESLSTTSANSSKADAKMEKKRKQEDEAMQKAIEAEAAYKGCVRDANEQQKLLDQVKCTVLHSIRDLMIKSDAVLKEATIGYFKLMSTITDTIPQWFQSLHNNSHVYDEGSHYLEYIKQLQPSDYAPATSHSYIFEPYIMSVRSIDSSEMPNDNVHGRQDGPRSGLSKTEDSDSISGGSSLSLESSPTTSPYQKHHKKIVSSNSMTELANPGDEYHAKYEGDDTTTTVVFRGVRLSSDAQTHTLRKLRTPSKCAQCDSLVYLQGAECEKCGIASHKKCLEVLRGVCSGQSESVDNRGGGLAMHLDPGQLEVPFIVVKCIQLIDSHGLNVKGIYRVSGVKSKVEQVCHSFETDERNVDLGGQTPNVIANVLKLYLRQLPEPLLTCKLYPEFIKLAKVGEIQGSTVGLISSLSQLVEQLPAVYYKTCNVLMHHLNRVAQNQEQNQMSAINLGIVFGPTLLRPTDGAASLNYLIETPYQSRIIEVLIENAQVIFGPDEELGKDVGVEKASASLHLSTDSIKRKKHSVSEILSPGYTSWYAPELTQDLLQELAKEEPHFLQLHEGRHLSPDVAGEDEIEEEDEELDDQDAFLEQTSKEVVSKTSSSSNSERTEPTSSSSTDKKLFFM